MQRAYSTFQVKAIDAEQRVIEGIASTPSPDRGGDVMEPSGAEFSLPLPFLWQHDQDAPIGEVFDAKVTPAGILVKARLAKVQEPGRVRDRLEEAWQSISSTPPLVRGLSIGWKPLEKGQKVPGTNFIRYAKWAWGELSAVTLPMNAEATILAVKSADQAGVVERMRRLLPSAKDDDRSTLEEAIRLLCQAGWEHPIEVHSTLTRESLAALGRNTPGDTGKSTVVRVQKDTQAMTTQEQITSFEAKRQANVAQMVALMHKSEGSTLDEAQREEYTTLEREVESIDEHLPRLKKLEQMQAKSATAITSTTSQADASALRGGTTTTAQRVTIASGLPKGTAFTRYVMAMAASKGDSMRAIERAKCKEWADTPEVELMVKSAVAAGTTTTSGFMAELAVQQPQNDFIELLRPKTLLGRIPNLRRVPFNVSVPAQTAGGTYSWVGQGKVKPLTSTTTATVTLAINKIAGIIVLTEELVKISSPSAEQLVRDEMIAGITKFMDEQFIDPSVAASGTVSPASITNGTTAITTAGTSADNALTDLKAVMAAFVTANLSTANAVWIMSEANEFALATAVNALGAPLFPGMANGNLTLLGRPVIATQSAGTTVALVDAQGILVADDGGVSIDVSREASLQMDTAPTDPADAAAVYVSMFQQNMVAFRAERFVTWKRARTASVKYVAASYV